MSELLRQCWAEASQNGTVRASQIPQIISEIEKQLGGAGLLTSAENSDLQRLISKTPRSRVGQGELAPLLLQLTHEPSVQALFARLKPKTDKIEPERHVRRLETLCELYERELAIKGVYKSLVRNFIGKVPFVGPRYLSVHVFPFLADLVAMVLLFMLCVNALKVAYYLFLSMAATPSLDEPIRFSWLEHLPWLDRWLYMLRDLYEY